MKLKILIILIIISPKLSLATFDNFSSPNKKAPQPRKIPVKAKPRKIKEPKRKIKTALLWELPDREFLGKKYSPREEEILKSQALERFITAASTKNPQAYKIYHSRKKNSELLRNYTARIAEKNNFNLLSDYIQNQERRKEEQKLIVLNEIQRISKLYDEMRSFYTQRPKQSKQRYQELKHEIVACCGLENFIFIENLLKREIYFEVFNS